MNLREKKCLPCEGEASKLTDEQIQMLLKDLPEWCYNAKDKTIVKTFNFKNFYKTMGFVNAIAFVANQENHHPDLQVGYNYCRVSLQTHAINHLSENDFIVASKIEALGTL